MSGRMTVVYLDHTGHVLAAMHEPQAGPPALVALIGDAFPLRAVRKTGGTASRGVFDLPASVLNAKSVALDERVIARPQSFAIDGDRVALLPDSAPPGLKVSRLSQTTIRLDYGATPAASAKVLSMVRGKAADYREQRIQAGSFVTTGRAVSLNLAIVPSGPAAGLRGGQECDICIALAGMPMIYLTETTP